MYAARLENPWRHLAEHHIWTLVLSIAGPLVVVVEFVLLNWDILDRPIFGVLLGPAPLLALIFTNWGLGGLFGLADMDWLSATSRSVLMLVTFLLAPPIFMTVMCGLPAFVAMNVYRWGLPIIWRALYKQTSADVRSDDMPPLVFARAVPVYLACAMPVTIGSAIGAYATLYGWGWGANEMDRYQEAALAAASGLFYSVGPLVLMFLRRDCRRHIASD